MARKNTTTAEKAFEAKVGNLLHNTIHRLHPESKNTPTKVLVIPAEPLDKDALSYAFFQYGTYLELIGGDVSVEQTQIFQWPPA